jgi:hypothetical protein
MALLCSALVLASGCSVARAPRSTAGVRALYRSIGIDASAGNFSDICRSYMDGPLRAYVERTNNDCTTSSELSTLERWAEEIRLSQAEHASRIVLSSEQALIYDSSHPERAVYLAGEWRLAEVPALTAPRRRAR